MFLQAAAIHAFISTPEAAHSLSTINHGIKSRLRMKSTTGVRREEEEEEEEKGAELAGGWVWRAVTQL